MACAIELALGKPTRKYVDFAMNRVRMLLHFGVKPYLVFDGDYLPSKSHTEHERAERRKESKRLGLTLLQAGKTSLACQELQKAIDVTPLMARELIEELKIAGVDYVVAPYEADSQLAYLERQGTISGIISEDSDLLVFGAKYLITKLDQFGDCIMIRRNDFTSCREVSLVNWSDKDFRIMAMLSGCDYLPGIPSLGLKTAYRLVRKYKTIEKIVQTLQFDGKKKVPADYLESFSQAERTFLHQWVFCTEARGLVNLNTLPSGLSPDALPFIGQHVGQDTACGVANGDLDPHTKEPLRLAGRAPHNATTSRTVQTPDLKQGKSISEFFKPSRTPLAELDPNSFTPSPSQQILLNAQRNRTWSGAHAPATNPSVTARAAGIPLPPSAPQSIRRTQSDQLSNANKQSREKKRLCSETLLASAMGGTVGMQPSTSRFFAQQPGSASPSLRKRSGKKAAEDFQLYSDDSTAEALEASSAVIQEPLAASQTTGCRPSPKKRKRLEVFIDPVAATGQDEDGSSRTVAQSSSLTTQDTADTQTPSTSIDGSFAGSRDANCSGAVSSEAELAKPRCAGNSATGRTSLKRSKSTPCWVQQTPDQHKKESRQQVAPSQHTEAIAPSDVAFASDREAEHFVPQSSPTGSGLSKASDEDNIHGVDRQRHPATTVEPMGSEDLLIPESPCSNEDQWGGVSSLDLGRFAFTA